MADRDRHLALASAAAGMAFLLCIALRQVRLLKHLPDPRGDVFDSDGIVLSKEAHPVGVPDGVLGLLSYGATAWLLAFSTPDRATLLRAKLVCDGSAAAFNAVRQVVVFGRVCSWCMAVAITTVPMVKFGWRAAAVERANEIDRNATSRGTLGVAAGVVQISGRG